MRSWLTPARRRGVEILDDRATPPDVRERSMADIVRSNALFGGTRSALQALRGILPQLPRRAVLVDVGTGLADIPARARRLARDAGITLDAFGVDLSESLSRKARHRLDGAAVADALELPFADNSADVVICSQLLHHFTESDARRLIMELNRVARSWIIVSDLRRSWLAAAGFWLASIALRFQAVTRQDGVTSVLRGFTHEELASLVRGATQATPRIGRSAFWRLSAIWKKQSAFFTAEDAEDAE